MSSHKPAWAFASLIIALGACSSNGAQMETNAVSGGSGAAPSTPTSPTGGTAAPPSAGKAGDKPVTSAEAGKGGSSTNTSATAGTPAEGSAGKPVQVGAGGATGSAGQVANAGGSGAAGQPAPAGAAGMDAGDPQAECMKALKPACKMRDTSACSSYMTVDVGTLVKGTEVKFGPYGAIMEYNVGQGFEIPVNSAEANCAQTAAAFGEPDDVTKESADLKDVDLKLYTVYRPACMKDGEKYPVITWGNGTCGQTEGYGALLRYVASYGYIVFAANSRYTGDNKAMTKALDFAAAANKDEKSVYFNRLDLEKIGAMGHSQGGMATAIAADDPRVKSVIIWNAGTSASKPFLTVSGEHDLFGYTGQSMATAIQGAAQPGAYLFYHNIPQTGSVSGHLTLMIQPERVVEAAAAWWDYQLKGDMKARDMFVGMSCGLCGHSSDYDFGEHNLK